VAKVCNNLILGASMAAVAEAFALGVAHGIDPKRLADVVNVSSGRCWSSDTYNPCPGVMPNAPAARGYGATAAQFDPPPRSYAGGFAVDLMAKDLSLAVAAGAAAKSAVPMASLAHQVGGGGGI
jgi:3-hydroxyisobutyrate dehydrogenase